MTASTDPLSLGDGDRGTIRAHPSDRAAHERSRSRLRPSGEHPLRGALRDPLGQGFIVLLAALVWGALMVTP